MDPLVGLSHMGRSLVRLSFQFGWRPDSVLAIGDLVLVYRLAEMGQESSPSSRPQL